MISYMLEKGSYDSSKRFSLSSGGSPASRGGVSRGRRSVLKSLLDHLGTQTSVSVGVLEREMRPWLGNFFQDMMPLITSSLSRKRFCVVKACSRSKRGSGFRWWLRSTPE